MNPNQIQNLTDQNRNQTLSQELLVIWENSVRATHLFLTLQDIEDLRPLVLQGIAEIQHLITHTQPEGHPLGFIGIQDQKIEMLFVDPAVRGMGIGKSLVDYAIHHLNVHSVDVNEDNPQATGFYEHLGFRVYGRSKQDEQGKPWPILHMRL
ncbi:acetyltransferase [Paenibacillus sp. FSL R7-277]|uniref:GNAT family N-acetyltransferase n=1 Tax=Paenibacillus sp. FSL R7-277 TaxID=1227352 RepID=UPI0003E291D3|nr:GNAT family N-acetyltransferase [Paenibacillus sp. FSL R7-277]ETT61932.1 acetyltransferase [Paenibacillus sp. FSL R7-277]